MVGTQVRLALVTNPNPSTSRSGRCRALASATSASSRSRRRLEHDRRAGAACSPPWAAPSGRPWRDPLRGRAQLHQVGRVSSAACADALGRTALWQRRENRRPWFDGPDARAGCRSGPGARRPTGSRALLGSGCARLRRRRRPRRLADVDAMVADPGRALGRACRSPTSSSSTCARRLTPPRNLTRGAARARSSRPPAHARGVELAHLASTT